MEKYIMLKLKSDIAECMNSINYLRKSFNEKETYKYYVGKDDLSTFDELEFDKEYNFIGITFSGEYPKYNCEELYYGKVKLGKPNLLIYQIEHWVKSKLIIDNFFKWSMTDLVKTFKDKTYLNIEVENRHFKDLIQTISEPYEVKCLEVNYLEHENEKGYDNFSQKNEHCKRIVGAIASDGTRTEFQRDRERIVHAKASRRLVDKAQIFSSTKGDHYRTRMTHTLEVSQIARGIATKLNLNLDLTEAIALAHDIGHTPFGHQGERTIDAILKDKIQLINNVKLLNLGGFKHNYQGLRVLTSLEEKYYEHEGLDLSYQVLEGVLKHTKFRKCESCKKDDCTKKCFDINEYLNLGDEKYLYLEYEYPTTLEGQIVRIADEIAQRGHDLDDAFASKHICFDELLSYCQTKKMTPIKELLDKILEDINDKEMKGRIFVDFEDIKRSRIVSDIIGYFISDVIENYENSEEYKSFVKNIETDYLYQDSHRFSKKLIDFSDEGKFIVEYLENIIKNKVINSHEVAHFDNKASLIVTKLFETYYNNPRLMPNGVLKRVFREIHLESQNAIDFTTADSNLVREEFSKITQGDIKEFEVTIAEGEKMCEQLEYILKRRIIVRSIADYIASMTDNFAINEYKAFFQSK